MADAEKETETSKRNFTVLREQVVDNDCFTGNTHLHAAQILYHVIDTQKGGITIGLEGEWGCGKSTVIHLLQSGCDKLHVFLFDAWAHEGDALRRTFVLEFLKFIGQKKLLRDDIFDKLKQEVEHRIKTTTRYPTISGMIFAVAMIISLLTYYCFDIFGKNDSMFINQIFIPFLILPLLVIACFIFCSVRKNKKLERKDLAFLQTDSSEMSEEEERTSYEFEKDFSNIMKNLYEKNVENTNDKIVFVIDNLDRIAPETALTLWSTLQTFLQKRSTNDKPDWFDKIYIIVPYDYEGIARLWNTEDNDVKEDDKKNCHPKRDLAKSFLDKNFQIRMEVPLPVMTDLEQFAEDLFFDRSETRENKTIDNLPDKVVQIDTDQKTYDELIYIFRRTRNGPDDTVTPREIKLFINQVRLMQLAANLICSENNPNREFFDIRCIAYYVIYRYINTPCKTPAQILDELLHEKFPEKKHQSLFSGISEPRYQFVGLIYGVCPTKGASIFSDVQYNLGLQYEYGKGVEIDLPKAVEWYTKAAEQGHPGAQCNLGMCYANGKGVEEDESKAVEWYTKAAEQDHAEAQDSLGECYYNGTGVDKDEKTAVEWFSKAAEQGHMEAQCNLGVCYANGKSVEEDESKAIEWYTKAAEQGHPYAQINLGWYYENGKGVKIDEQKAFEWYSKAAKQGDIYAQNCLERLAEQGLKEAQYYLGMCYENGTSEEKDIEKAIDWYTKAAEQGLSMAQL